jgi:hypothetical protein
MNNTEREILAGMLKIASTGVECADAALAQLNTEFRKRRRRRKWIAAGIYAALILLSMLLLLRSAYADNTTPQLGTCLDKGNTWCVQPATAAGWQLNLADWDAKNAVILLGGSLVHTKGFAIGFGIYGGAGLTAPHAPQLDFLVSLASFGAVGVGLQRVKFPDGVVAYQTLFGLYGNLNFGGTPKYIQEQVK